jgi:hypothetical protein
MVYNRGSQDDWNYYAAVTQDQGWSPVQVGVHESIFCEIRELYSPKPWWRGRECISRTISTRPVLSGYPGSRIPTVRSLFEWSRRCQVSRPCRMLQMAAAHRHTAYRATSGLPTSELCAAFLLLSDDCPLTENCEQLETTQQLAEFQYQEDYNAGTTLGVGMSFWCFI